MRTKTLVLTAVLSAATVVATVAQSVYSVNAVGFVNKTVGAGQFALLANPLDLGGTNTLLTVLPDVPNNTAVYKWKNDSSTYDVLTKRSATLWTGAPSGNNTTLNLGEGFFIKNVGAADFTITFVGEVKQGTAITTPFPAGFGLIASQVPQAGKVQTDLGLPAQVNDVVYVWNAVTQGYKIFTKRSATLWTGVTGETEPAVGVAEGFFLKAGTAGTWTRSFSVNQ